MDRVVHFEIPAENLERAKKFYSRELRLDYGCGFVFSSKLVT